VNWVHSAYNELLTGAALKDVQKDGSEAILVPISSKGGDKFLDLSKKSSWYSSGKYRPLTVVQAIDS
jgi:translation elongation factor EF-1alpha